MAHIPSQTLTVYKTRENLPMRPPPGSSGCNQEKLNTLPLAKTRRPHLASTCHLLPRPLASILRVGVQQDPFLSEPQRLGSRLSRDYTQFMCMCCFCFKLSSRTSPAPPAPYPSVRS